MAQGSGRKPLVADKRYSSGGGKPPARKPKAKRKGLLSALFGGSAKPKAKPKPRKSAPRKAPAHKPAARKPAAQKGLIRRVIGGLFGGIFRLVWGFSWRVGMVVCLLTGGAVAFHYMKLPELAELLDGRARGSVTMLDRDGKVYAWRGNQFGGVVTAESVSPHLSNAIVATEDKRFYRHFGISPRGVASAVRINLSEGRGPLSGHGGSTITQQTAKLMCLGVAYDPDKWESEAAYEADCRQGSLWRKMKEAVFAMAMEVKYSKDDILSIYMNRAYMGGGAYGAEAAAQRYFGKSANQLEAPAERRCWRGC